jgi:hypothetical protein
MEAGHDQILIFGREYVGLWHLRNSAGKGFVGFYKNMK